MASSGATQNEEEGQGEVDDVGTGADAVGVRSPLPPRASRTINTDTAARKTGMAANKIVLSCKTRGFRGACTERTKGRGGRMFVGIYNVTYPKKHEKVSGL